MRISDWSSDVCSSDLGSGSFNQQPIERDDGGAGDAVSYSGGGATIQADPSTNTLIISAPEPLYRSLREVIDQLDQRRAQVLVERSEARRVGKECVITFRSRRSPSHEKKNTTQ